jgi:hypothetical protein
VLQEGFGRLVVLEEERGTVRKTFSGCPREEGRALARAELTRLRVLETALGSVPGASCPHALELVDSPAPGLRMTFADGENLVGVLARPVPGENLQAMVRTIAAALRAYVDALGEPYHDFKFDNVLHDATTGVLTFVDLGLPQDWRPPAPAHTPLEVSLGQLLGSVVFETARPVHVARRHLRRQIGDLAVGVVAAVVASGEAVRHDHLAHATRDAYLRATFHRRIPSRTAWYATVGYARGRRLRLPGGVISPVPVWRA